VFYGEVRGSGFRTAASNFSSQHVLIAARQESWREKNHDDEVAVPVETAQLAGKTDKPAYSGMCRA